MPDMSLFTDMVHDQNKSWNLEQNSRSLTEGSVINFVRLKKLESSDIFSGVGKKDIYHFTGSPPILTLSTSERATLARCWLGMGQQYIDETPNIVLSYYL